MAVGSAEKYIFPQDDPYFQIEKLFSRARNALFDKHPHVAEEIIRQVGAYASQHNIDISNQMKEYEQFRKNLETPKKEKDVWPYG